ncbi:TPA: ECs1072 family phage-associated protein [Escherichia coli]
MELDAFVCLRIFEKHCERVAESYRDVLDKETANSAFVATRALILLKLDLLLVEYRRNIDSKCVVLFGKNVLYHYLFTQKGVSLSDAKNMCLHDILIVLWNDINAYVIPEHVSERIQILYKHELSSPTPDLSYEDESLLHFKDSAWDFYPADTRLN